MFWSVGPAKLPASHRERLAGRADGDGSVPHARQLGHADHLVAVEDHVLIHVVADHQNVVLLTKVTDLFDFGVTKHLAQWVVGVVEDNGLGFG